MNIWGKVLAFLIILLGAGAFILTTQLLDFRHSWVKQVETNAKRLSDVRATTAAKRRELAQLQAEYERLMLGWDTIQSNVTAAVPAPDTVQLTIGPPQIVETKDKDGQPVLPIIHAFKPDATGKYVYVGEFRAERLAVGNSSFKSTLPLPDDATYMQPGQNWRIRTRIPMADKLNFIEFSRRFLLLQEHTLAKADELKSLTDDVAPKIETNLSYRETHVGESQLPTLAALEEARNAILAEADSLRHQLHTAVTTFAKLNGQNGQALSQFPKTSPTVSKR